MQLTDEDIDTLKRALDAHQHLAIYEGYSSEPQAVKKDCERLTGKLDTKQSFTDDEIEVLKKSLKSLYQMYENHVRNHTLEGLYNNKKLIQVKAACDKVANKF